MEKTYISGVAQDKKIARIAVVGLENVPGVAYKLFSLLAKNKVNVDIILQSIGRGDTKDISFTVNEKDEELCMQVLQENQEALRFHEIYASNDVAKISIVGSGMVNNAGVAASMFEALYKSRINIHMISTSEIKISVLIDKGDSEKAMRAIHDQFFD